MQCIDGKTVCVTSGTNFFASELIKTLLEKGCHVRTTVRDCQNLAKTQHLIEMQTQFNGQLELLEAEFIEPGAFDKVVEGCEYVFHTSFPSDHPYHSPDVATLGTKHLFDSVAKHKGQVKKVIITSSFACICGFADGEVPGGGRAVFNEEDWNSTSTKDHRPFLYVKVCAERAAWASVEEHKIPMVVLCPTHELSPPLPASPDGSWKMPWMYIKAMLEGGIVDIDFPIIDNRDLAVAHIKAAELTGVSNERIIVSHAHKFPPSWVMSKMQEMFPDIELGKPDPPQYQEPTPFLDNSKMRDLLGVELRPVEETLRDTCQSFIDKGMAKPVPKGQDLSRNPPLVTGVKPPSLGGHHYTTINL